MRRLLIPLLFALALPALAQNRPADLQPVPEPPPPPPGYQPDPALEPQVTIIKRGEDRVEEYRINGRLYMVKVTPAIGPAYFLVDQQGDGNFVQSDTMGPTVRPPMWILRSW